LKNVKIGLPPVKMPKVLKAKTMKSDKESLILQIQKMGQNRWGVVGSHF
jgi:hypothetical protein